MWIVITLVAVAAVIDLAIIRMVHNALDGGGEE